MADIKPSIDQSELSRIAALGQGKKDGSEDEGGSDNALMEVITNALNRIPGMVGRASSSNFFALFRTLLTTGALAGLEARESIVSKKIMVSQNFAGSETFLYKLFAALKKGGMSIQDLTKGIEAQQAIDISFARLGELSAPITPSTGKGGIGMELG